MALKVFMIKLDNPRGVYFSGEILSGKVLLVLDSPKSLDALYITLKGAAIVSWNEKSGDKNNDITTFRSEQFFFNTNIYLVGNCGIRTHLPVGHSVFPFTFPLPRDLPPSFEGEHGHIRYTIKATMDRPWKFNQDAKVVFSVIPVVDLNMMPVLKKSMNQSNSKNMCCFCCASGPLAMTVYIPFCGVVPGQQLPLSVDVENSTSVNISQVKCTLIQRVTYIANNPHTKRRKEDRKMQRLELGSLTKNSSNSWEKILTIPACPTTVQRYCNIINVEYFLQVKACPIGCHSNLCVEIPLTVGTVPLIFHGEALPPAPTAPSTEPGSSSAVHPGPPPNYQIPPPSYEECMFGARAVEDEQDTQYTHGVKMFAPVYPVYKV